MGMREVRAALEKNRERVAEPAKNQGAGCTKTCQGAVERLHSIDFREDRNAWFSIDEISRRSKTILVL